MNSFKFKENILRYTIVAAAGLAGLVLLIGVFNAFFAADSYTTSDTTSESELSQMMLDNEMMMLEDDSLYRSEAAYSEGGVASAPSQDRMMISPPTTEPGGSYTRLQAYETTDYNISAELRSIEAACNQLELLRDEDNTQFRSLHRNDQSCRARFFVEENDAGQMLDFFRGIQGVSIVRDTRSVTSLREQTTSQLDSLKTQLERLERTIEEAEVGFDEAIAFARTENDAAALARAINQKTNTLNNLYQQELFLNNQIQDTARRSQDIDERIGLVGFSVQFTSLTRIDKNYHDRAWSQASEALEDRLIEFQTGVTLGLFVLLLWIIQIAIYGVLLGIIVYGLWKLFKRFRHHRS